MKIIAAADLHGSQFRLNILLKNIERYSPDLIVICGDITQFGPGELAKNLLDQIPVDTIAITGNIDTKDVRKGIDDSKAVNIEAKRIVRKGIPFVGLNGIENEQIKFVDENKLIDEETVLVTHIPPYGLQDKVFLGLHAGSKEIRKLIDIYKPRLVLCGHIHEDPGYTKSRDTFIVNCSMGKSGGGALIEIGKEIKVEMLEQV